MSGSGRPGRLEFECICDHMNVNVNNPRAQNILESASVRAADPEAMYAYSCIQYKKFK
jgi:hypothetical protein